MNASPCSRIRPSFPSWPCPTRCSAAKTYLYFETYTIVALIYLIITLILSKCVSIMEHKLNYYDRKK